MAPYRTVSQHGHAEAPRDAGLVDDIIAQFADPLAFYRELVQNAIDADSPSVEVELVHDTRVMTVRVRDRGCGMTRDVLENQLLVLFRSTKEDDRSKIGKFGIGFASVLAPNPSVVVVQTARDGRRLALHLARDLTYQIFDAGPATQTGTTVELELPISADDARAFVDASHDALVRWCRHATVPIELRADVPGLTPPLEARIDRPLRLDDALVEVRGISEDRQLTAIVGIARDATPYAGFFNHGLMLYETREPLVGKLAFKIQDARLGHTLSRDNVRRDEHFARALHVVRTLAEDELPKAIDRALLEAATDRPGRWEALAEAVISSQIGLAPDRWTLPLVDATPTGPTIDGARAGQKLWTSARSTPVTAALAGAGVPVVRVAEHARSMFEGLRELLGAQLHDVGAHFTLVTPLEQTPHDLVFSDTLLAILEACHRGPPSVVIAKLEGAHSDLMTLAGGADEAAFPARGASYLLELPVALSTPFTRTRRRALVVNANHALVRMARGADDPRIAAAHFARGVLLQYRILDRDKSEAILDYTLGTILRGAL